MNFGKKNCVFGIRAQYSTYTIRDMEIPFMMIYFLIKRKKNVHQVTGIRSLDLVWMRYDYFFWTSFKICETIFWILWLKDYQDFPKWLNHVHYIKQTKFSQCHIQKETAMTYSVKNIVSLKFEIRHFNFVKKSI